MGALLEVRLRALQASCSQLLVFLIVGYAVCGWIVFSLVPCQLLAEQCWDLCKGYVLWWGCTVFLAAGDQACSWGAVPFCGHAHLLQRSLISELSSWVELLMTSPSPSGLVLVAA